MGEGNAIETYPIITVFGWDFKMLDKGQILCRNTEKGLDWAERQGKSTDLDDSHLWAVRSLLGQLNQIFPRVQPHRSKTEAPPENVAPSPNAKVG